MHGLDRVLHDVGIEARSQSTMGHLEIRDPRIHARTRSEESTRLVLVCKRHGPRREELPEPDGLARVVTAGDMPFEHHEAFDEIRARRCGEERRVRAHRLTDEDAPLPRRVLLEYVDDVVDEGLARQIRRSPGCRAMPPLIH